jgi:hypothetical protein
LSVDILRELAFVREVMLAHPGNSEFVG